MKQNNNALMDALFKNLTRLFAFLVFILLAAIMVSLIYGSRESLAKYGLSFLWLNDWDPVNQNYGAVVPIIGTLLAETKLANQGLGYAVIQTYATFDMPRMYALLIVVFLLAVGINAVLGRYTELRAATARSPDAR